MKREVKGPAYKRVRCRENKKKLGITQEITEKEEIRN